MGLANHMSKFLAVRTGPPACLGSAGCGFLSERLADPGSEISSFPSLILCKVLVSLRLSSNGKP